MHSIQNGAMYSDTRKRAVLYYMISLFCNFIKIVLIVLDILAFSCFTLLSLLFMFFGYFGIVSNKPSVVHAQIYIGTVYIDIMLNFLITFSNFYNIFRISTWNMEYWEKYIPNSDFFYSLSFLIISFCILSTLFNIFAIYHAQRFTNLMKSLPKEKENEKHSFNMNKMAYSFSEQNSLKLIKMESAKERNH
ncbi:hypothetical protein MKS88_004761 [Plasmodium brasilianum]|uniref:Uncharacterized protein n=2 Tax=Plasmodium (Plasmodium) TaxID=418103 RepID=A0A1D3TC68_PLAMA|nr:conserved Plasmodium protein, unknown function [Plasmodium malariae]KAI4835551.1 hypothetical protein MKS88_004761 [Plasmodium brasilianum]SCP02473.1 conserved Plasmodium protein, unknown function [Plasmodium malariae]